MKKLILTAITLIFTLTLYGQVLKYKSTSFDIEKPNIAGYETKYITTFHKFDFDNNLIKYEYYKTDGTKASKIYSIKAISDDGMYYRCSINASGIKNIWLSKGLLNIEYEFTTGIKFVYYDLIRIQ